MHTPSPKYLHAIELNWTPAYVCHAKHYVVYVKVCYYYSRILNYITRLEKNQTQINIYTILFFATPTKSQE